MNNKKQKKKNLENEIKVKFIIRGFQCSPDEITKILGIPPTKTWVKGDIRPHTIIKEKENGWLLDAPGNPIKDSLEKQVDMLFDILIPKQEKFVLLPSESAIILYCVIYSYKYRPIIGFTISQIKKIAQIGANLDIDSYDLS